VIVGGISVPATAAQVRTRRLGKGIVLKSITQRNPRLRIKVASVSREARHRIQVVLGSGRLPGLERTSGIARRKGAVVAINGDYARPSGRPVMAFAQAGSLLQTPLVWGRNFALTRDGEKAYIGHPHIKVELGSAAIGSVPIKKVNAGGPRKRSLALFTRHGGTLERPPRKGCSARLLPEGIPRRAATGGLRIRYRVGVVRCSGKRLRPGDGVIVSARPHGPKSQIVRSLRGTQATSLTWSLGWEAAYETVGGNPTLVENGRVVIGRAKPDAFYLRHPRTGVGIGPQGKIFFVTVDGRQRRSKGMTLRGFANFFRYRLGASWALNLDGGGSTTMVAGGRVLNSPSDGRERPVSSALVVLPIGGARRSAPRMSVPGATIWDEVVADPASTGGLADTLVSRGRSRPRSLRAAARTFRAQRAQRIK
jgi:hypothetical protein